MSKSFLLASGLAVSGLAFFAGSLVTLSMVSGGSAPEADVVTRAATPQLTAPVTEPTVIPVAATPEPAAPAAALSSAVTAAALAVPSAPENFVPNLDIMQQAAANFRANGGEETLDAAIKRNAVSDLNRGRDASGIYELLSNAARNGLIEVPQGLTTADGGVDTRSLLFDIVNRAVQETDDGASANRAVIASTGTTATTAPASVVTPPKRVTTQQVYTVEPGDSLAFIALQFYGSTGEFRRIFNANRDKLSNPDRISVGQRLIIPVSG